MILGSPKDTLDQLLGRPILGRTLTGTPGEKTWTYPQGDFDLTVGFVNDLARTMAAVRRRGPSAPLTAAELAGVLALNGPSSQWTLEIAAAPAKKGPEPRRKSRTAERPTTYLSLVEKDPKTKDRVLREIQGWMPGGEPYAFFFLPALDGQPPVLVSEWGVHQALG
jgi:hypothetical protein